MKIREIEARDHDAWRAMRVRLWPQIADEEPDEQEQAFNEAWEAALTIFVAEDDGGELVGFLELSRRSYAPGCTTSPVPFIEGWWVAERVRQQGIGGALVRAAEDHARAAGFTEIGSDVEPDNAVSLAAHAALGYEETDRVVSFRRSLRGD